MKKWRRRSLLRRTRAHGKRSRAPEGRKGRKTGGEVRSGKNTVINMGRREGRRRVGVPKREKGRRMIQARGNRSVRIPFPCRMPFPLTTGDPVFGTANIASSPSSSIDT